MKATGDPTIKVDLPSRQSSVQENLRSHTRFAWNSPACKSPRKQVQTVCLHRWLPKHVPAQASLVIVVGSLRLALRAGRKWSPPPPPFCKAEPWNSRTVKWLFPSPLFYETCISLFFPHLSIHVRCWAHAALSVDACIYLVWCVCVCVRGEAVSYSFYISNPTSIGSCWVLMNSANISSLFAFFFFFETFSYLLWY